MRRRHLGPREWLGMGAGLLGVVLVVQSGTIDFSDFRLGGDLLTLGAAGAWAWYGIVIGPVVATLGPLRATWWTMVIAALCLTPFSFAEVQAHNWASVSWKAWAGMIYNAIVGMGIAMAIWGRSIHRLGVQQTMLYAFLEPVFAILIAGMFLGELLGTIQAIGALLTLIGVAWASRQK